MNNRIDWDHSKLEGGDADIETSLVEYGLAWIIGEGETLFYYGIGLEDTGEPLYNKFDFCTINNDIDVVQEYDWANFADILSFVGMDMDNWLTMPLTQKISDLLSYYGYENIFGSSYWEGLKYSEIISE